MENVAPFVRIGNLLHGLGFSTRRKLAVDQANGFVLLERDPATIPIPAC